MSSSSLNGLSNLIPNTLDGLFQVNCSSLTIDGVPVVAGGGIDTALEPLEISGTNANIISCPNLVISSNNPSTTYNDFQGYRSGGTGTGSFNVCMGRRTGVGLTIGQNNTLLGYTTGDKLTSGNNNIMINCNAVLDTASDNIIIGNNAAFNPALTSAVVVGLDNAIYHDSCNIIGDTITTQAPNSSYMNNIRNITNSNYLSYNTSTKEITYETKPLINGTSTVITSGATYNFTSADLFNYFVFTSSVSFLNIYLPNTVGLSTGSWISICKAGLTGSLIINNFGGSPVIGLPISAYSAGNAVRLVLSSDNNWYSG